MQDATPAEVARAPRTAWAARRAGLNHVAGLAGGTRVVLDAGGELVLAEPASGRVAVVFPPSAVALHRGRPEGSARATPGRCG